MPARRRATTLSERLIASAFAGALRLKRLLARNQRLERLLYAAGNRQGYAITSVHDVMLADRARTGAYARGIEANVGRGDVVVDLGTGVGVLACLAARQGAEKVYAIDHESVERARELARANGLSNVEFQQVHSDEFRPAEPVDVIIQEQIGTLIFNERMVPNVVSLRERVLRPGGRVLPNRFDIYLEPVQLVRGAMSRCCGSIGFRASTSRRCDASLSRSRATRAPCGSRRARSRRCSPDRSLLSQSISSGTVPGPCPAGFNSSGLRLPTGSSTGSCSSSAGPHCAAAVAGTGLVISYLCRPPLLALRAAPALRAWFGARRGSRGI
jgi:SAM-dependent methyltransferase